MICKECKVNDDGDDISGLCEECWGVYAGITKQFQGAVFFRLYDMRNRIE